MKSTTGNYDYREQFIAALLWYGTWLASAVIAAGIVLGALPHIEHSLGLRGYDVVKSGVAMFILLPIVRVALMLVIFLRERDYVYVVISAFVLAIITVGIVVEL